ncbi:type II toxin-antitoxin system RelE/ParE family toxin [Patescibacteria group bacterium]|nr:type II toxin-antitoxin system RelE/ParE family toxin [Patescibacteria group bacterium]MBU1256398.1 type II toxin-antitoxin system RelE/ParE family toxin [Patescibacteria group bacterium]MBU1457425.1 type II toxin-antitoxin system RelE/ParE family toxin [Patescibacteria group bacterium]
MEILLSSKAKKQIKKLPPQMRILLTGSIVKLSENPMSPNSKKLAGRENWRLRVGNHRILYTFNKKELIILSLSHRRDAYRLFLF